MITAIFRCLSGIFADEGALKLWSRKGIRPTVDAYKRSFVKERFTITVMTTLIAERPCIFKIQSETGTAFTFVEFLTEALPSIAPHSVVLGDNCSFHCKGL